MTEELVQEVYSHVKGLYERYQEDHHLIYHNWDHTNSVWNEARDIARHSNISKQHTLLLEVATLFHDAGYLFQKEDHEYRSARLANEYLQGQNVSNDEIVVVQDLILATRVDYQPQNILEEIIKDADMSMFGKPTYPESYKDLLMERRANSETSDSDFDWWKTTLKFMRDQKFFTSYAEEKFGEIKEENIIRIMSFIESRN